MTIALPNLDDRRWPDLVEEGRALIPVYAPEWTDHNVHDPGVTLLELFASVAELDIFELDQISDARRRKFLELIGVEPAPPRAAGAVLAFRLGPGQPDASLPGGVELAASERLLRFRTLSPLTVLPVSLRAVLHQAGAKFTDLSRRHADRRGASGEVAPIFGLPQGDEQALYLGLHARRPLAPGKKLSVLFDFSSQGAGQESRRRLLEELSERRRLCTPFPNTCAAWPAPAESQPGAQEKPLGSHSAVTVWEYWSGTADKWREIETDDRTRALTLDGPVVVTVPSSWSPRRIGPESESLLYLRCRLVEGEYDAPVEIRKIAVNAVEAEQSSLASHRWRVTAAATPSGPPPAPADVSGLAVDFSEQGEIAALGFVDAEPRFQILEYEKQPGVPGWLTLALTPIGRGNGAPAQEARLREAPVVADTVRVFSLEETGWREWDRRNDFLSSGRADAHYRLDPTAGIVLFGDGERGRTPPAGSRLFAAYRHTAAERGNAPAGTDFSLEDSAVNRALLGDVQAEAAKLDRAWTVTAGAGGAAAETLAHAIGRAIAKREAVTRAVTLRDYETLALETPGAQVARAEARANLRPGFDCLKAAGHIAVLIVPNSDSPQPRPSPGLIRAVRMRLEPRRVIGTRVEVFGPEYVTVTIRAKLRAFPRADKEEVQRRAVEALHALLHPLRGGPTGGGWPFGRDVYRSEILEALDRAEGVDHVLSADLEADGCGPRCGNICLPPNALVASGAHEIEVI